VCGIRSRRCVAAGLIRRLHGVHSTVAIAGAEVILRSDVAGEREYRWTGDCRGGRSSSSRQFVCVRTVSVGVDLSDGWVGAGRVGIRVLRGAGADQVLVVQERAAEGRLVEVVSQDILL